MHPPIPPVPPAPKIVDAVAVGRPTIGMASWYQTGPNLQRTCTGAPLRNDALTAASPTLPTGTKARVTLLTDHRSVLVRINDCMPHGRRIIDLSVAAARNLGLLERGVGMVRVTPVAWH